MSQSVAPVGGFIRDLLLVQVKKLIQDKLQEIKDALTAGDASAIETILKWIKDQLGIKLDLFQFFELYQAVMSGSGSAICQEISDVALVVKGFFSEVKTPVNPSNPNVRLPAMMASSGNAQADSLAACGEFESCCSTPMMTSAGAAAEPVEFVPEAVAIITLVINLIKFVRERRKKNP